MGAWLVELDAHASSGGAAFDFVNAAIELTEGSVLLLRHDTHARIWERGLVGGVMVGFAGVSLGSGIHALGARSTHEKRLARWRALRAVDAVELARFEGELALEAELAHSRRRANVASGFGLAGGGVVTIALTAVSPLRGYGAAAAYGFGGIAIALGLWEGISSAVSVSREERAWEAYTRGDKPEHAASHLRLVPVLAQRGGGVGLGTSF